MNGIVQLPLRAYLSLFTRWARYPEHARREQEILIGSLEFAYDHERAAGRRRAGAIVHAAWSHVGELQPFALIDKLHADDECVSMEGEQSGRVWWTVSAALFIASAALTIWGPPAAQWLLLAVAIVSLGSMAWSACRPGTRWLITPAAVLFIWPFVDVGAMGVGDASGLVSAAKGALAIFVIAWAYRRWGNRGDGPPWGDIVLLASLPLCWGLSSLLQVELRDWMLQEDVVFHVADDPSGNRRFQLMQWLTVLLILRCAFYWAVLAVVVSKVATQPSVYARDH